MGKFSYRYLFKNDDATISAFFRNFAAISHSCLQNGHWRLSDLVEMEAVLWRQLYHIESQWKKTQSYFKLSKFWLDSRMDSFYGWFYRLLFRSRKSCIRRCQIIPGLNIRYIIKYRTYNMLHTEHIFWRRQMRT